MKSLPWVTMAAVACTKVDQTIRAMQRSMKGIQFGKAILITDKAVQPAPPGIDILLIERLDYKAYNHFILYRLKDYIHTEYALIVQHDGYVVRPSEWRDEFLDYDYIGAPWPKGMHLDKNGDSIRVGNGGFSLRSKKLLEAPIKLNLPFTDYGTGYYNEDGFLCNHNRKLLEDSGIRFAPIELASKFSQEKKCDDSYPTPFGVHNPPKKSIMKPVKKLAKRISMRLKYSASLAKEDISSLRNEFNSHRRIQEYRKNIKIYDAFIFFNELDLLEIRLNILDPYVDYFVIVEATETFSGMPKPLYYAENKKRFEKWNHKIIHHVLRDMPHDEEDARKKLAQIAKTDETEKDILNKLLTSSLVGRDKDGKAKIAWLHDFYQKESIRKALAGLDEDDFCFISDLDEIWNPRATIDFSSDSVFKLKQKMYTYYLNNRTSERWSAPFAAKYKNIRNGFLNGLRNDKKGNYVFVRNGGWHFTNQGGAEQIRKKLESYSHQEYNTEKIKSQIDDKMRSNIDFAGRKFKFWKDENDLPKYILENKEKYKKYFK